jgi:hypothetical protein
LDSSFPLAALSRRKNGGRASQLYRILQTVRPSSRSRGFHDVLSRIPARFITG